MKSDFIIGPVVLFLGCNESIGIDDKIEKIFMVKKEYHRVKNGVYFNC